MSYIVRYTHPTTSELIEQRQDYEPAMELRVMLPRQIAVNTEMGFVPSCGEQRIATFERRGPIYHTIAGEPIYDFYRVR